MTQGTENMTRNLRVTKLGKHQICGDASAKITETSGHYLYERWHAAIMAFSGMWRGKTYPKFERTLTPPLTVPVRISLAARYRCWASFPFAEMEQGVSAVVEDARRCSVLGGCSSGSKLNPAAIAERFACLRGSA